MLLVCESEIHIQKVAKLLWENGFRDSMDYLLYITDDSLCRKDPLLRLTKMKYNETNGRYEMTAVSYRVPEEEAEEKR